MSDKMNPKYMPKTWEAALGYLVEEAGEVLAAAGKTIRWGRMSSNPELPPEKREANVVWLMRELRDLERAIGIVRAFAEDETPIGIARQFAAPSPETGTAAVATLGPVEDGEWCHFCGGWSESNDEDMCTSCGDDNIVTRQYRRVPVDAASPPEGDREVFAPPTSALCPRCGDRVTTKFEAGPPWNGKTVFVSHAAKGSSPRAHCRESGQVPAGPAPEPVKPPATSFVSQECSQCQDEGWISVPDGGELMGVRAERCPVGCPDEIERARTPAAGTAPTGEK